MYRARQISVGRDVALKVLVGHGAAADEMAERFRREVQAVRNLTHPNTVRLFDFRESDEGLLYYTMEHLRGETIKDVLRREGPLSPRRTRRILRQVLKSLAEAHSHGIIHRDLKPANIMLVDMHGETDFVKVLDFGIAKRIEDDGDDEGLTATGMLVGTLQYMAPEQVVGEDLGPHTDLYVVGLIAAEMLAGKSVLADSGRRELLELHLDDREIAVGDAVRRSALGLVIERAIRKPPGERYQTAEDMLADLDAVADWSLPDQPLVGEPHDAETASRESSFSSTGVEHFQPRPRTDPATDSMSMTAISGRRDGRMLVIGVVVLALAGIAYFVSPDSSEGDLASSEAISAQRPTEPATESTIVDTEPDKERAAPAAPKGSEASKDQRADELEAVDEHLKVETQEPEEVDASTVEPEPEPAPKPEPREPFVADEKPDQTTQPDDNPEPVDSSPRAANSSKDDDPIELDEPEETSSNDDGWLEID